MSIFLALTICGCTTVQTSELPPDELQAQIATGQLVEIGDHVTVTTIQGLTYELTVTEVTEQSIKGEKDLPGSQQQIDENADISMQTVHKSPVEIPVAEIRTIQTREVTKAGEVAGATVAVAAVGGIIYFMYFLLPVLLVSAIVGL